MIFPSLSSRSLLATALLAGALDSSGNLASAAPPDTSDRTFATGNARDILRCGVENISGPDLMKLEEEFRDHRMALERDRGGGGGGPLNVDDPLSIDVYLHVIAANETSEGGNVAATQIEEQIDVLNTDYQTMKIDFKLQNVTRTIKPEWFNVKPDSKEQAEMKRSLRRGGPTDLNVYLGCLDPPGLLGYSTFPRTVRENIADDGVVVLFSSLPGGTAEPYNEGKTLTHEVGHWLGLYHTFQGGCDEPGDFVDDTPAEAKPGFGCPEGRKTCRHSTGLDPIHNFMDYGDDSCLSSFSLGQAVRAREQIAIYRGIQSSKQGGSNSGGGKQPVGRPGKYHHDRRHSF
ncbi:hypothetical protein Ac2012v2_006554 [Leucoagaricus gongylophorus]